MKRMRGILLSGLWLLALAGCTGAAALTESPAPAAETGSSGEEQTQPLNTQPEEMVNTAMYVPMGNDGAYILVDQQSGSVFTVTMPKELYGLSGERIEPEQLQKGNILEITGNGCMLESYPGQYPGVTKIQVVSQGKPEDADIYQEIVDAIWQEPDLSQPPELTAEYQTPLARVAAHVARGSWQWSFKDENGQVQTAAACGAHPLQWGEALDENPLHIGEAVDIRLLFSTVKPEQVQAVCWPVSQRGPLGASDIPQGEEAALEKIEGEFILLQARPGYVYQISAAFPAGEVIYAFLTD